MINNTTKYKFNKILSSSSKTGNFTRFADKDLKFTKKQRTPAIKEWSNSIYNFNKNCIKNLSVKNLIADRLIKMFFYLVKKSKYRTRSIRMDNHLKKLKTNRLFLSKPEIKQTSDKNIITVYNYDREKESFVKKFFYYKRLVKTSIENTLYSGKKNKLLRKRFLLNRLPLTGRKLNLEIKLYEKKLFSSVNKFKINKNKDLFFKYLFLKWIFSGFNVKVNFLLPKGGKINKFLHIASNRHISKYLQYTLLNLGFIYKNGKSINLLFKENPKEKGPFYYKHNYILNTRYLTNMKNIIMILYVLLEKLLNLDGLDRWYKMNLLYKWYKKKYYKRFLKAILLRKIRLDLIRGFYVGKLKFSKYLPLLKLFLNRIYNKKIEINLINLKYPYLSSDIFVYSLATKLRDRTRSLALVVKNYLGMIKLIRLPLTLKKNTHIKNESYIINKERNIMTKNLMDLNNVKSKWITGMRVETAGRLTNRYVAQRSVYKYRQMGNLKSIEYKPVNIRTYISPNIQKSYVQSIRRIGAFGIKGWISSN